MKVRYWLAKGLQWVSDRFADAAVWVAAKPFSQRLVMLFGWMG